MDKRFEVAEALMDLSRASQRVASLIAQGAIGAIDDEAILTALGSSKEIINIDNYTNWPEITNRTQTDIPGPFEGMRILEFNAGPQRPLCYKLSSAQHIDLITHGNNVENQPTNVRIINQHKEQKGNYDVGIIWESLEFVNNPATILELFKKCCHKIYIRFRPWSSRNGAFMASTINKAFAHLVMDMDHEILFKVVRPLAAYESLIKSVGGIPVHERRINTIQPDTFFTTNEEVMRVIRERTWGKISYDQAIKIMATDSVDYVLGYSIEERLEK